jgi:hypothetical protein
VATLDGLFPKPLGEAAAASAQQPFDVIVAGGGTAGIVSALTALESGLRVLLADAGPLLLLTNIFDTDLRFNRNAQRSLVASVSASPSLPSGAPFGSLTYCLGGRGLFWTGATPRFDPLDFAGWPFTFQELEPFYAWAEALFGVNDRLGKTVLAQLVTRRLRLAGYDALPGPTAIDRPEPLDERVGGNIGNALGPLLRSPFFGAAQSPLTIVTNAFASAITHDGVHADGVTFLDGDRSTTVRAKAVVVACGGFESVRLALASNIPDDSGLIGRLINDHIFVRAFYPLPAQYYTSAPELGVLYVRADAGRPFQLELHMPNDNLFALRPENWAPAPTQDYSVMVRAFGATQPRFDNFIALTNAPGRSQYTVHFAYSPDDLALQAAMVAELEKVRGALPAAAAEPQSCRPAQATTSRAGSARAPIVRHPLSTASDASTASATSS